MRERERGRKSGFAKCEKRQMRGKNKKEGIEKRVEPRLRMSGCGRGKKKLWNVDREGTERRARRGGRAGERSESKSKTSESARNEKQKGERAIGKDKFDNKKENQRIGGRHVASRGERKIGERVRRCIRESIQEFRMAEGIPVITGHKMRDER